MAISNLTGQFYESDGLFRIFDEEDLALADLSDFDNRWLIQPRLDKLNLVKVGRWKRTDWGWECKLMVKDGN